MGKRLYAKDRLLARTDSVTSRSYIFWRSYPSPALLVFMFEVCRGYNWGKGSRGILNNIHSRSLFSFGSNIRFCGHTSKSSETRAGCLHRIFQGGGSCPIFVFIAPVSG
jgi:hypothetical protein